VGVGHSGYVVGFDLLVCLVARSAWRPRRGARGVMGRVWLGLGVGVVGGAWLRSCALRRDLPHKKKNNARNKKPDNQPTKHAVDKSERILRKNEQLKWQIKTRQRSRVNEITETDTHRGRFL